MMVVSCLCQNELDLHVAMADSLGNRVMLSETTSSYLQMIELVTQIHTWYGSILSAKDARVWWQMSKTTR